MTAAAKNLEPEASPSVRQWTWIFAASLVIGLVVRILFIYSEPHQWDSDNSVVYLMARHVTQGEFSLFYWGQAYGGTLLQLVSGAVFVITGPNPQILSIVGVLFWLASAIVLRSIAVEVLGTAKGTLAAVLYWLPSYFILRESTLDPGFYGPGMVLSLGAMWLALTRRAMPTAVRWLATGLALGLALWTSPGSFAMAAPAAVILAWRYRRPLLWAIGGIALAVGASPLLLAVVNGQSIGRNGLLFETWFIPVQSSIGLVFEMIPSAFPGGKTLPGHIVIGALVIGAAIWLAARAIRTRSAWFAAIVVGTVLVAIVTVVGAGNNVLGYGHARYAAFFLPALVVAAADVLGRWKIAGPVVVGLIALMTIGQTAVVTNGFRIDTSNAYGEDVDRVVDFLDAEHYDRVYGSFWIAYRLAAATDERIIAADLAPRRYAPYEELVAKSASMVMVFYAGGPNDALYSNDKSLPPHTRTELGIYVVYEFQKKFDPYLMPNGFL